MSTVREPPDSLNLEAILGGDDPLRRGLYETLAKSWCFPFRKVVLPALPVDAAAEAFGPSNGPPAKDLRTMTGLVVAQQLLNLTDAQVLDGLVFDRRFHIALGLDHPTDADVIMAPSTFADFKRRLLTCDLDGVLFADVAKDLFQRFAVEWRFKRINPVRLSSNLKKAGRLAIMSAAVENFLSHLRRRRPGAFETVDPGLAETYLPNKADQRFGQHVKPSECETAMLAVATDLSGLVFQFGSDPEVAEMDRYKTLARVLNDQCDVKPDGRPLGRLKGGDDDALIRADRDTLEDRGEDL